MILWSLVLQLALLFVSNATGLRVMLLTGGCWHNYTLHAMRLRQAFRNESVNVQWRVISIPCSESRGEIDALKSLKWTNSTDLVLMNACYDAIAPDYVNIFVDIVRNGTPFVPIHCALHSFRDTNEATLSSWWEAIGIGSKRHEEEAMYAVRVVADESSILSPFIADNLLERDELYVVDKVMPNTKVIGYAMSSESGREYPVFWTSLYQGKTRVFGTTFGHSDTTWNDTRYSTAVVRGALWAAGRLEDSVILEVSESLVPKGEVVFPL